MSTLGSLWTALPNGFTPAGDRLKISVLFSPRLTTDAATGTLAEFPLLLNWPDEVQKLKFTIDFQAGPSIEASPVVEPGFPALDPVAWQALFTATSPVNSYQFGNKTGLNVRSFPTKRVVNFLQAAYQKIAVQSGATKPTLQQLGLTRGSDVGFGQIVLTPQREKEAEGQINALLSDLHAVPPDVGFAEMDFYQVQLMHQPLSRVIRNPDGTAKPLPPQDPPKIDFHQAIAALGQYAKLLRALGIAIDFEIPLDGISASGSVRITPRFEPGPLFTPWTSYSLAPATKQFCAAAGANSDVSDSMLLLSGPDQYEVVEFDVDGAAEKAVAFATSVARLSSGDAKSTIDTPQNYGLPSLRSAGFSCARVGRATRLVTNFTAAKQNNQAITANPRNSAVVLVADDVTRGYRVDVWSSLDGEWRSLSARDGVYHFLRTDLKREFADEGFVTIATSQSADGTTTDLYLPESIFRWRGWSLSAPRPGRTIGGDSTPATPANPATTEFKLEAQFRVTKASLPRLRFGALYQFRARAVDLAGNSQPLSAVLADNFNLPPQPIAYLRAEPVPPPVLLLRQALSPTETPGESFDRIVIRSNFNTHIAAVSERHIVPPKTTDDMLEWHGMLDTAAGPPDKALYGLLSTRDGTFEVDPAHPDQPVPHSEPEVKLPYLTDPFAPGAAFRTLPGTPPASVWKTPFAGDWPDPRPFRLKLDEGSGAPTFTEDATERVLTVQLPKAEVVTVELSCFLTDDETTRPPKMLSTMQIWAWILEAKPSNLTELQQLALDGGHWMLTPPRTLTLVHAVQQPLIEPQFQNLTSFKGIGSTQAVLVDEYPVSGKSTIQVDMFASWQEPVDDLSPNPQPVLLQGATTAFSTPLQPEDSIARILGAHEFHDTKHRQVTYQAIATTRFREYFPPAITNDPENLIRKSEPQTVNILSSARPDAPKVRYVLPTFAWESQTEDAWNFSRRRGGGLRIYLDRPWFSSGEGELLGALLWGCPPTDPTQPLTVPDVLRPYVTQWGRDPIWAVAGPPAEAVPREEHFLNAVAFGHGLTLDELTQLPDFSFTVAGHTVAYDDARRLWFCDIELDIGLSYFPFVRLALARYQPDSLPTCQLSRAVLADFVQLTPDRSASITLDPIDPTALELAVSGRTDVGVENQIIGAILETQPAGSNDDAAWVPVQTISLQRNDWFGPTRLWTAQITLPAPRSSQAFRLVIEEFEVFQRDREGVKTRRLVYADILNI